MARRNHNSRRSQAAPGWVWMLFGLSLGLVVAIGVYLRVPAAAPATTVAVAPAAAHPAPRAAAQPAEPKKEESAAEERFSFYEILPQFEVEVRDDDVAPTRPAARPRPAEPPGSFLLQAGSFSASADADRLQANLALLGLESHVQRVTIEDDVFHRVRIGPIADVDAAKRTQRRLRDAGIDALLMRVPN
jgi:cell division protein FtsN